MNLVNVYNKIESSPTALENFAFFLEYHFYFLADTKHFLRPLNICEMKYSYVNLKTNNFRLNIRMNKKKTLNEFVEIMQKKL